MIGYGSALLLSPLTPEEVRARLRDQTDNVFTLAFGRRYRTMFWFNRIYIQQNVWFRRGYGPVLCALVAADRSGSCIATNVRMSLMGLVTSGFWLVGTGLLTLGWSQGDTMEALPMTIGWGILTAMLVFGVLMGRGEREGLRAYLMTVAEAQSVGPKSNG